MSLGLGIFLSSTVFALLILYWITRDRWNWRLMARRVGKALGALVVLGVVVGGGFYGYAEYKDMPRRQDTYAGIKLGATMAEVLYLKGQPTVVLAPAVAGLPDGFFLHIPLADIPKGERIEDYARWEYSAAGTRDGDIAVVFSDATHKVRTISCYSVSDDAKGRYACPTLLGITARDDEATVLRRLGPPTTAALDGIAKKIEYTQFGVRFYLEKGRVYWLQVVDYDAAPAPK